MDSLGHSRDGHVASERLGELSPGAHGDARGDAARAKVDEGAVAILRWQSGWLVEESAVDGPLPWARFQGRAARDEAAPHPLENSQGRGRGGHSHVVQQASNSLRFTRAGGVGGGRRLRAAAHARDSLGAGGDDGGEAEFGVDRVGARGAHVGAEDIDGRARIALVKGSGQPEDLLEAVHGLASHESEARGQGESVAGDCLGKSEGRGHRNLERGRDGIRAVAVISPRERDLVATILEGAGDALRTRPRPAHPRAGNHGNDENLHDSRVRRPQSHARSAPTHRPGMVQHEHR